MSDDARIRFLTADVALFCAETGRLEPEQRLRLVTQLRSFLDEVTGRALKGGMRAARRHGWGLRRIGAAAGLSHEKVRYRLAWTGTEDGTAR
ncbi:hypothetical protein ACFWWA_36645 [Streptomyces goshikiensis]|uniref:hypothetical protein n=1 Tax=Streptomyces goshikiensis TaxID=1942 RepID=UPI00365380FF